MLRYALAPAAPTPEQVLAAIPQRATRWTLAQRSRGMHRLLVPVDASLESRDALRYVVEHLAAQVATIHLLNVQRPLMAGDVTPLVDGRVVTELRHATGARILRAAGETILDSSIPVTHEIAFGEPAQTICRVAEKRECTGIVIGVGTGFDLVDLILGSVAAQVIRLACVPVTIVNARTAANVPAEGAKAKAPPERIDALHAVPG